MLIKNLYLFCSPHFFKTPLSNCVFMLIFFTFIGVFNLFKVYIFFYFQVCVFFIEKTLRWIF